MSISEMVKFILVIYFFTLIFISLNVIQNELYRMFSQKNKQQKTAKSLFKSTLNNFAQFVILCVHRLIGSSLNVVCICKF